MSINEIETPKECIREKCKKYSNDGCFVNCKSYNFGWCEEGVKKK